MRNSQAAITAATNIETLDKDGATPLMIAAGFNHDPIVIPVRTAYDYAQLNPNLKGTQEFQDLRTRASGA